MSAARPLFRLSKLQRITDEGPTQRQGQLSARNLRCILLPAMDDEPDYLICVQCETPTYQFEFINGKLATIICNTCGADDPSDFVTESEYDEQTGE